MNYAETLGVKAKAVESAIATAAPQVKNNALAAIADALLARQEEILAANAKDLEAAVRNHMTESLQDRLRLTPARISGMANAARQLIAAEDPIGSVDSGSVRPNGLQILKTRVPLGVIGIIFESRPNVTVDAARKPETWSFSAAARRRSTPTPHWQRSCGTLWKLPDCPKTSFNWWRTLPVKLPPT